MAAALVQMVTANNGGGVASLAVSITPAAGNVLYSVCTADDASTITFTDNQSGSWTTLDTFNDVFEGSSFGTWAHGWRTNTTTAVATTVTVTFGAGTSTGGCTIYVVEVSGVLSSSALIAHTAQPLDNFDGTATDSVTSGPVTAAAQPALIVSWCGYLNSGGTVAISHGTGFTDFGSPGIDTYRTQCEFKRITSTGSVAGTWTGTGTGATTGEYDILVAVFQEAAVGPAINTQPVQTTVYAGQTAVFTVSATTSGGSLSYQWTKNGSNVGTNSNSYTTPTNTNSNNLDIYQVSVTDSNGTVMSSTVYLIVIPTGALAWIGA